MSVRNYYSTDESTKHTLRQQQLMCSLIQIDKQAVGRLGVKLKQKYRYVIYFTLLNTAVPLQEY